MNSYYINKFNNNKFNNNIFMSEVPVSKGIGYLELYVFKNIQKEPITDAVVTIYARQGDVNVVPVMRALTTTNPITLELPVAHPLGTLIKSPEYYYTTYNMTIDAESYYGIVVNNIRIFPGIKVTFNYILNKLSPGVVGPQRSVVNIPTIPID